MRSQRSEVIENQEIEYGPNNKALIKMELLNDILLEE